MYLTPKQYFESKNQAKEKGELFIRRNKFQLEVFHNGEYIPLMFKMTKEFNRTQDSDEWVFIIYGHTLMSYHSLDEKMIESIKDELDGVGLSVFNGIDKTIPILKNLNIREFDEWMFEIDFSKIDFNEFARCGVLCYKIDSAVNTKQAPLVRDAEFFYEKYLERIRSCKEK
jgi:hypothetical protein